MIDQVSRQPNRELIEELEPEPELALINDIDPAELEKIAAIDPPIWEGITDRKIDPDLAEVAGEETRTPDGNVVDEIAAAVGIEIPDREILHTSEILAHRDTDRWELDPQSAEDHQKHQK